MLYTLNMYSLFFVYHTSIKWFLERKKSEHLQKYQTKFTYIFLEAFLRKTTKNPTIKIFTKLYKIKTFRVARLQNQKDKCIETKKKQIQYLFSFVMAPDILANAIRQGEKSNII